MVKKIRLEYAYNRSLLLVVFHTWESHFTFWLLVTWLLIPHYWKKTNLLGTQLIMITFHSFFPLSALPKVLCQPTCGTPLPGCPVQVGQETLPGKVVHPPRSGERHAGPVRRDVNPPRRSYAHPHLPPALEQPGWHRPCLGGRPAHLPQATHRVSRLLPGPHCAQWEGVGGATAAGVGPRRQLEAGL